MGLGSLRGTTSLIALLGAHAIFGTTLSWAKPKLLEEKASLYESFIWHQDSVIAIKALDPPTSCPGEKRSESQIELIKKLNRDLVNKCAIQGQGKKVDVIQEFSDKCSVNADGTIRNFVSTVRYAISSDAFRIKLGKNIAFYDDEKNPLKGYTKQEFLTTARSCAGKISTFFRSYDIDLDLTFSWDSMLPESNQDKGYPTDRIFVTPGAWARQTSAHYTMSDYKTHHETCSSKASNAQALDCFLNRTDSFCRTMMHEIGHLLGLPDEYVDEECPAREFDAPVRETEPFSIMSDTQYEWEKIAFYPRHIAKIIQPLCGENALQNTDQSLANYLGELLLPTPVSEERADTFCKGASSVFMALPLKKWPSEVLTDPNGMRAAACAKIEDPEFQKTLSDFADTGPAGLRVALSAYSDYSSVRRTKGQKALPASIQAVLAKVASGKDSKFLDDPEMRNRLVALATNESLNWNCSELSQVFDSVVRHKEEGSISAILAKSESLHCLNGKNKERLFDQKEFNKTMQTVFDDPKTKSLGFRLMGNYYGYERFVTDEKMLSALKDPDEKIRRAAALALRMKTSVVVKKADELKQILLTSSDDKFMAILAQSMVWSVTGEDRKALKSFFESLTRDKNPKLVIAGAVAFDLLSNGEEEQRFLKRFIDLASDPSSGILASEEASKILAGPLHFSSRPDVEARNKVLKLALKSPNVLLPLALQAMERNQYGLLDLDQVALFEVLDAGSGHAAKGTRRAAFDIICRLNLLPQMTIEIANHPEFSKWSCTK